MMQHLEANNTLYELQHGFRAKRSCESQIISLIHELSQKNDKNIQIYNNNGLFCRLSVLLLMIAYDAAAI
jgi:hypothetical protein